MNDHQMEQLRALEGRWVSLALADGSRIDDGQLVSAGRTRLPTIWIFADGTDRFVPISDVLEVWESVRLRRPTAA
jgi:hypothetical protein